MAGWAEYIAYAFVVCFVGLPALTIIHELGHALVALALTGKRVVVRMGRPPVSLRLVLGRLEFQLRPFDGSGFYQILDWEHTPPRQRAWAALGGPAATLLVLVAAACLAYASREAPSASFFISRGVVALATLQLVLTLPPIRYPGWWGDYAGTQSDGYHFLWLWSREPQR